MTTALVKNGFFFNKFTGKFDSIGSEPNFLPKRSDPENDEYLLRLDKHILKSQREKALT